LKPELVKRGEMLTADDVLELLAIELIGIIPDDENVIISTNRGQPVAMDVKTKAGQAFHNISRRLKGESVAFLNLEEKNGFFNRLSRVLKPGGD
jgi:septum site-determining protein MinD